MPRWGRLFLSVVLVLTTVACGSATRSVAERDPAQFGAYVSPSSYTDPARIAAVESFEEDLGRKLDIVQNYRKWDAQFPTPFDEWITGRGSTLLLSWGGTDAASIVAGREDETIRRQARAIQALGARVLLRWRWEMNRPNLREEVGGPASYRRAWRRIWQIFQDEGVKNVEWVWCPLANGFAETDGASYYPGDDYVDWLCADAYSESPREPLADVLAPFEKWAESVDRPVLIGEFGTTRGAEGERAEWLAAAFAHLRSRADVRAVLYYESANAPAGDYSLTNEPSALAEMRRQVHAPWLMPAGDRSARTP